MPHKHNGQGEKIYEPHLNLRCIAHYFLTLFIMALMNWMQAIGDGEASAGLQPCCGLLLCYECTFHILSLRCWSEEAGEEETDDVLLKMY